MVFNISQFNHNIFYPNNKSLSLSHHKIRKKYPKPHLSFINCLSIIKKRVSKSRNTHVISTSFTLESSQRNSYMYVYLWPRSGLNALHTETIQAL